MAIALVFGLFMGVFIRGKQLLIKKQQQTGAAAGATSAGF
jgi:hypothetical protein